MSEKSRELWQVTAIIAINLILLIIISYTVRANAVCLGQSGEKVAVIQKSLTQKGVYHGEINGEYDFETRKAVKKYQQNNGIADSGEADFATLESLGLGVGSGECFSVETEILARYLKLCGGSTYHEMLKTAENILSGSDSFTLSYAVFSSDDISCETLISAEPSSVSFSAALHTVKSHK